MRAHPPLTISCPQPHCCAVQDCAIQSVGDSIIVCTLPDGNTAGANTILVTVDGKGYASSLDPEQPFIAFTNPLGITGVSPSEVSLEGGGEVTITGEVLAYSIRSAVEGGQLIFLTPNGCSCSINNCPL